MSSVISRHPKKALALVAVSAILVTLLAVELILRVFAPFHNAPIGHIHSRNAERYGWGYDGHKAVKIRDPDTGQIYMARTNRHGWRDLDRRQENERGAFRVLVLGDSITFGAIVPDEAIYTRILESKLAQAGFDAEVINIAYGRWGTDQELEALKNEGLTYRPDLVIFQFTTNDLQDNTYFSDSGGTAALKPFHYAVDADGALQRLENPHFKAKSRKWGDDLRRTVISNSEVLKRVYSLYLYRKFREAPAAGEQFSASESQIAQLQFVLNLDEQDSLYRFLRANAGKELAANELSRTILAAGYEEKSPTIRRLLEKRYFHHTWTRSGFFPPEPDSDSPHWQLYFALMKEAHRLVRSSNARLAIFNATEIANYEWTVSWYRVSDDPQSKANYLRHISILREFAGANGIGFVDNRTPYQPGRNDPHPNAEGNAAMAADLFEYLMENFGEQLERHRSDRKL